MKRTLATLAVPFVAAAAQADCGPFFFPPVLFTSALPNPTDLHVADLDHDGLQEIIVASRISSGPGVTVIKRNFAGLFTSVQFLALPNSQTSIKFVLEDADNDGILDLLVTEYAAGSVRIHRGLGNATFDTEYVAYNVGPTPTDLVLKDLNRDRLPDLVVANFNDNTISVLMGAAGGGFFPRATFPAGGTGPNFIGLTDFNGDGRDDAVTVVNTPAGIAVSLGNGNGSFQAPRFFPAITPELTIRTPVIQDMTADGVPDLVAAIGSQGFVLFQGQPNGTLISDYIQGDINYSTVGAVAVADYDMDGLPDVCAITGSPGEDLKPLIYRNLGNRTFAPPLDFGGAGFGGGVPFVTHFDRAGDGLPDPLYVDRFGQICTLETAGGGAVQIWNQPQNQTLAPGAAAELGVTAAGAGLSFRWYKNGEPVLPTARVTGVDSPLLQIANVTPADAAVYECRVSTMCNTKSVYAFIAVQAPANPCPTDFNADGFIDFFDYDAFVQAFEEGC